MKDEPGRIGDWDELMKTMLLPTPATSSCRLTNKSGTGKAKKNKKKKSKSAKRGEPKFEFLLCTVFRNVFGSCSKDSQGSSIKVIAHKIHQLETKVNDIQKNCTSEKRDNGKANLNKIDRDKSDPHHFSSEEALAKNSPDTLPESRPPSADASLPRSPPSKSNTKEDQKSRSSSVHMKHEISTDSADESFEIKGLKFKRSNDMREEETKERDEYLKTLKRLELKPPDQRIQSSTDRRKSPRYSVDLFRRRTTQGSAGESRIAGGSSQHRRDTHYIQTQPKYIGKAPEIEASSSTSIPTYVVQNETEYEYVTHGTGQRLLTSRKTQEELPHTDGVEYTHNPFTGLSSDTCICDWRMMAEPADLMRTHREDGKGSLFIISAERERAPVCFAAPVTSSSSESLRVETVCIVKSKSSPLIGKKFRH